MKLMKIKKNKFINEIYRILLLLQTVTAYEVTDNGEKYQNVVKIAFNRRLLMTV